MCNVIGSAEITARRCLWSSPKKRRWRLHASTRGRPADTGMNCETQPFARMVPKAPVRLNVRLTNQSPFTQTMAEDGAYGVMEISCVVFVDTAGFWRWETTCWSSWFVIICESCWRPFLVSMRNAVRIAENKPAWAMNRRKTSMESKNDDLRKWGSCPSHYSKLSSTPLL